MARSCRALIYPERIAEAYPGCNPDMGVFAAESVDFRDDGECSMLA